MNRRDTTINFITTNMTSQKKCLTFSYRYLLVCHNLVFNMDARYWLLLIYEQSLPLIAPKPLLFTPLTHAHVNHIFEFFLEQLEPIDVSILLLIAQPTCKKRRGNKI